MSGNTRRAYVLYALYIQQRVKKKKRTNKITTVVRYLIIAISYQVSLNYVNLSQVFINKIMRVWECPGRIFMAVWRLRVLRGRDVKELCLSLIFPQEWYLRHRSVYKQFIWEVIPESTREKVIRVREEQRKSQYRFSLSKKPPPIQLMVDQKGVA